MPKLSKLPSFSATGQAPAQTHDAVRDHIRFMLKKPFHHAACLHHSVRAAAECHRTLPLQHTAHGKGAGPHPASCARIWENAPDLSQGTSPAVHSDPCAFRLLPGRIASAQCTALRHMTNQLKCSCNASTARPLPRVPSSFVVTATASQDGCSSGCFVMHQAIQCPTVAPKLEQELFRGDHADL